MHNDADEWESGPDEGPSKTELKRRMTALQELGVALTRLSDKELAQIPIADARLAEAIVETRRITTKSARRRHLQFIGKLMRDIDPDPLQRALDSLYEGRQAETDQFHALENLRDDVLVRGDSAIQEVIDRWPHADRQQLRQLIRQHQREKSAAKPLTASRKLFRYLRELQDRQGDG